MILTYHTGSCIKATSGDTSIVFGPVSKESKAFKPTNFGVDVALISVNHADMNGAAEAARGEKQPFVISGPGEYELKDITVSGFGSTSGWGKEERINTVYSITFDGLHVLYCGALNTTDLPEELVEMDAPDVLIVPIGGEGMLDPAGAQKLSVKLEAKIVIPVLFDAASLKTFLKEAGAEGTKAVDKLTLKVKDIVDKQNEVVVLEA